MNQRQREEWLKLSTNEVFSQRIDFGPGERPHVHENVLRGFYPQYPMIPIELFKDCPNLIEKAFKSEPLYSFLSSGTSARERSRSSFSGQGLRDYKDFSCLGFVAMLDTFFKGRKVPGVSLIPPITEWTTSSLAQMVAWVAEIFPLSYWRDGMPTPQEPIWVFATGFHIVAFADAGGYFPLPPGSIVIETGGTKGKTRSVTREETYNLIEECFRVDRNHIVSEYGMCELASQAYDFVQNPQGKILSLKERWFRFPIWAQTKVLDAAHKIHDHGNGSLVVSDQTRSDIKTPFRTEDRVELRSDGAFQLEGRVAFSPLKGCSLLAEDILAQQYQRRAKVERANKKPLIKLDEITISQRAKRLHSLTQTMLNDPRFAELVRRSLVLEKPSEWCLADLKSSVPQNPEAWVEAALESQNTSNSWLMIPPRSHDFALMQPLFMAAILKLKVVVRETKDTDLLRYWQALFADFWTFGILSYEWRIEEGTTLPAQSLLVFGSDETIEDIKAKTSHPVHGFGNWVTVTVIHASSWLKDEWVKDAFSLNQEGCMSSRLLLVWDDACPRDLSPRNIVIGQLSLGQHLHLAHSEVDLALKGFQLIPRPDRHQMVLGHKAFTHGEKIHDSLSTRPLTLPIIRTSKVGLAEIFVEMSEQSSIKLVTLDERTKRAVGRPENTLVRAVGHANEAPWTGWHGMDRLFFPRE